VTGAVAEAEAEAAAGGGGALSAGALEALGDEVPAAPAHIAAVMARVWVASPESQRLSGPATREEHARKAQPSSKPAATEAMMVLGADTGAAYTARAGAEPSFWHPRCSGPRELRETRSLLASLRGPL
jgi:hypothetical protein